MNLCRSIKDVCILFSNYDVLLERNGNTVQLLMPPTDDWAPSYEPATNHDVTDPSGIGFKRQVKDVCGSLADNPQFRRCTSVAHFFTDFAHSDQGRGLGIVKLVKKAGVPFTVHFATEQQANYFMERFFPFQN